VETHLNLEPCVGDGGGGRMRSKGVWWCVDDEELTSSASTEPPLRAARTPDQLTSHGEMHEAGRQLTPKSPASARGSGRQRGTLSEEQGREREARGSGPEIAQRDLIINSGSSRDIHAYIVVALSLPDVSARQVERAPNAESAPKRFRF
jgi:hypothetical protein